MYLGTALKIAIPFAILDREDLSRAYGEEGPAANEAQKACEDLRALEGLKVAKFTPAQRETARLALCWAEQYLFGYLDALTEEDTAEVTVTTKQLNQIRAVRLEHFGYTENEVAIARSSAVPAAGIEAEKVWLPQFRAGAVVCSECETRTNSRTAGEVCSTCNTGIFQDQTNLKN